MKNTILLFFLLVTNLVLSQQVLTKTIDFTANEIALAAFGLDEIKIVNSTSNKIEVTLLDENPNTHTITAKQEFGVFKIGFKLEFIEESTVFRKFITKRLNRVSVLIKVPKNKTITVHGEHVDVISKSYQGNLKIYIDKGLVNLHKVQANVELTLFQGNVFADLTNSNIDLLSRTGTIKVNNFSFKKNYQKVLKNSSKYFKVNSIKANIFLLHDKSI